jgi:GH24 family phage-related lysozyme (muramidase)
MISAQTFASIRRDEGYSAVVYDDATGLPIKKGSVVQGNPTMFNGLRVDQPVPRAAGDLAMQLVTEGNWAALLFIHPWLQTQPDDVQGALQNMAYNLGAEGVAGFQMMLAALQRGDREAAALNCLDSFWAKQVGARAERVADLIRGRPKEGDE